MTRRGGWAFVAVLGVLVVGLAVIAAVTSSAGRLGQPPAPPATGSGSGVVALSQDAARYPGSVGVQAQFQRHFDAINARDYAAWKATVTDKRATQQSEAKWRADYASTTDGSIRIDRIDQAPDGALLVRLRFVSTQNVADAPDALPASRLCWLTTLPLEGSPPRIGVPRGETSVGAPC